MPLDFIPPHSGVSEVKTIRFDAESYNIVVDYAQKNEIEDFGTALKVMLRRIARVGAEDFYELTQQNVKFGKTVQKKNGKVAQVHNNSGTININDKP